MNNTNRTIYAIVAVIMIVGLVMPSLMWVPIAGLLWCAYSGSNILEILADKIYANLLAKYFKRYGKKDDSEQP